MNMGLVMRKKQDKVKRCIISHLRANQGRSGLILLIQRCLSGEGHYFSEPKISSKRRSTKFILV